MKRYDFNSDSPDIAVLAEIQTAISLITRILEFLKLGLRQAATQEVTRELGLKLEALENRFDTFESSYPCNFVDYQNKVSDKLNAIDESVALHNELMCKLMQKNEILSDRMTRAIEEVWAYLHEARK